MATKKTAPSHDNTVSPHTAPEKEHGQDSKTGQIYIVKFVEWHAYVGRVTIADGFIRVQFPKCIRDWGTSKGLGELYKGPLSSTVLDLSGELYIPMTSVITLMCVDQAAWEGKLAKSAQGGD
jgi:hypothetical protein